MFSFTFFVAKTLWKIAFWPTFSVSSAVKLFFFNWRTTSVTLFLDVFPFFSPSRFLLRKKRKIQNCKFRFGNLAFPVAPSSAWHVSTLHWINFNGLLLLTRVCWKLHNFSSSQKLIRSSISFVQNNCYFLSKWKFPEDRNCRWKHWRAIFFQNARLFY